MAIKLPDPTCSNTQESIMLSNHIPLTAPFRVTDISHDLMNLVISYSALFSTGRFKKKICFAPWAHELIWPSVTLVR